MMSIQSMKVLALAQAGVGVSAMNIFGTGAPAKFKVPKGLPAEVTVKVTTFNKGVPGTVTEDLTMDNRKEKPLCENLKFGAVRRDCFDKIPGDAPCFTYRSLKNMFMSKHEHIVCVNAKDAPDGQSYQSTSKSLASKVLDSARSKIVTTLPDFIQPCGDRGSFHYESLDKINGQISKSSSWYLSRRVPECTTDNKTGCYTVVPKNKQSVLVKDVPGMQCGEINEVKFCQALQGKCPEDEIKAETKAERQRRLLLEHEATQMTVGNGSGLSEADRAKGREDRKKAEQKKKDADIADIASPVGTTGDDYDNAKADLKEARRAAAQKQIEEDGSGISDNADDDSSQVTTSGTE